VEQPFRNQKKYALTAVLFRIELKADMFVSCLKTFSSGSFLKKYELAKEIYLELRKKQKLLKIAKKLKGIDDNLAKILGAEDEKGKWVKLKVFWSKYYTWMLNHKKPSTVKE